MSSAGLDDLAQKSSGTFIHVLRVTRKKGGKLRYWADLVSKTSDVGLGGRYPPPGPFMLF